MVLGYILLTHNLFRMKSVIFIVTLMMVAVSATSQPHYICKYNDSIGILDYEKQIESMKAPLMENGMSLDIFDTYISKYFPDKNAFLVTSERDVVVYKDSSIIDLRYNSNKSFHISFELPSSRLKVERGKLFRYSQSNSAYIESIVSDSSVTFFQLTSKRKIILGYTCLEYINLDGSVVIWVCDDLPSVINPGISVKNVKGAVLAFEARNGNGVTKSCISKIEKKSKKFALEKTAKFI